mmetsp:Transcript_2286/g.4601  ORF Transcript_2286/g.4601 Transcript_2286/m.4601 type:complete len:786 (-) Transcript_2286:414-2771(-)|eukprot:CAMPEP_0118924132 /NCGR_PEP_ID=MMETSP1169-20130426/2403_1 /TAXON_ID=36882 /ORGANISM="Pyramimonas obovata, Strain CCMP722" /LENGTH=785 /DNA_ID=CAMNT_0006865219 /DNA_START=158 /DNA_END=2515 /DNA_ORIENTATION=-
MFGTKAVSFGADVATTPKPEFKRKMSANPLHVQQFLELLGFERLSRSELDDIHLLWMAEYKRRFGAKAALQTIGNVLINFQFAQDDDDLISECDTQSLTATESGLSSSTIGAEDPSIIDEESSVVDVEPLVVDAEPSAADEGPSVVPEEPSVAPEEPQVVEELPKAPVAGRPLSKLARVKLGSQDNLLKVLDKTKRSQDAKPAIVEGVEDKYEAPTKKQIQRRASKTKGVLKWRKVALSKQLEQLAKTDPWADRAIIDLATRTGTRIRLQYNNTLGKWDEVVDEVIVKLENKPFAAGAMRECFAMKKLSNWSSQNWKSANNMVAKRYKTLVDNGAYYDDMLLQMDSKRLGLEYNKTHPPKQVDFMQVCLVDLHDVPEDQSRYSLEHLLDGEYIKYNSNQGFVEGQEDCVIRNTPQAFSHFTFEYTKGASLVVDVQGVGDLYTDPQIHTCDGEGYGEGNLGLRGMALFFRAHTCNALCKRLHLQEFRKCPSDDVLAGTSASTDGMSGTAYKPTASKIRRASSKMALQQMSVLSGPCTDQEAADAPVLRQPTKAAEWFKIFACMPKETSLDAGIHYEVSKLGCQVVMLPELHPQESVDEAMVSARFHLRYAAHLGHPLALLLLAKRLSGLGLAVNPTHFRILFDTLNAKDDNAVFPDVALKCMELAAERGVRNAAAAVAEAYKTGTDLGASLDGPDLVKAKEWYEKAVTMGKARKEEEEESESFPGAGQKKYALKAALAALLMEEGGGLEPDLERAAELFNEAADAAMEQGKGKLAQKYYEQAAMCE